MREAEAAGREDGADIKRLEFEVKRFLGLLKRSLFKLERAELLGSACVYGTGPENSRHWACQDAGAQSSELVEDDGHVSSSEHVEEDEDGDL